MTIDDKSVARAESRMSDLQKGNYATRARYDRSRRRIAVTLSSGVEVAFRADLVEGLSGAPETSLGNVEISASGLGLHWPDIDADVYVPSLLEGVLGSESWMARQLGAKGGSARTHRKVSAARANGQKGGRPRKRAVASSSTFG